MKKLMSVVMPIKAFSTMIFAGLMVLYMVAGSLYAMLFQAKFDAAIPFVFVWEAVALSVAISALWSVLFGETIIKKWRTFPRLIVFSLSMLALLALCLLVFLAIPTHEAKLWLFVAAGIEGGVIVIAAIGEMYFKATGKRYTEILQNYKERIS